jgi:hypothetical protein
MTSIILSCKIWKLGNWNAETIGESTGDSGALNCAFQRLRTATDDGLRRPTLLRQSFSRFRRMLT